MNIQDIADFLDLVKNPAKYDKLLQQLKDENDRRIAVIETVGKVSEINSILDKTKKQKDTVEEQLEKQRADLQTEKENQENEFVKTKAKIAELLEEAKVKNKASLEREKQAAEKLAKADATLAGLVIERDSIAALKKSLEEQQSDLADKQAKLKNILG